MSWIHREDHIRLMCSLLVNPNARGPINLTAPHPVTNTEFTATLARVVRRPAFFRIPATFLQWILGEMAGLLLESTRVVPEAALKQGFSFEYPELEPALREALGEN
jgi:NAD dependent epimerase/dehydratase family enzyme